MQCRLSRCGWLILLLFAILTLPQTALAQPSITRVFHTATRPLNAGDTVTVVMLGTERGRAQFEILGETAKVPMQETSLGRYEASFRIPKGLVVNDGIVLVTLSVAGRDTAKEADRLLTIGGPGGAPAAGPTFQTVPRLGSTQSQTRPVVSIQFPARVQTGTASLFVDGINFTRQARLVQSSQPPLVAQMEWAPSFDLDQGRHTVEVKAIDEFGQPVNHTFWFNIATSGGPSSPGPIGSNPVTPLPLPQATPAPALPRFRVTNLVDGIILGPSFVVQGVGIPGSRVMVTVEHPKHDLVSMLLGNMLRFQSTGTVAPDGTFAVNLDAGAVGNGDPMTITVSDSASNPSVAFRAERGLRNQQVSNTNPGTTTPVARPSPRPPVSATPAPLAYTDRARNFSVNIPAAWVRDHSDPNLALKLLRSPTDTFGVVVAPGANPQATLSALKAELAKQGATITQETPLTVSQLQATGLEFNKAGGGDGFMIVCPSAHQVTIIVAESNNSNDPTLQKDVADMIASFRITDI